MSEIEFTPVASLLGGAMIGLSAVLLMAMQGRIAGMTGILAGVLPPLAKDWVWRAVFLVGAIISPILYVGSGGQIDFAVPPSTMALIIGGLIVGVGVYFGSGCTSGHGVCGIARFSPRSVAATGTFMATAIVTVYISRHVIEA